MLSYLKLVFNASTFEKLNSTSRNNFSNKKPILRTDNFIFTTYIEHYYWRNKVSENFTKVGAGQCQHEKCGSHFVSRGIYLERIPKGIMSKLYQINGNENIVLVSWAIFLCKMFLTISE